MRHLATLAAAALAAGLVATGCGSAANMLQGKTPTQIVQLASAEVVGQSYRMSVDGHFSIDTSGVQGLPAGVLNQMTAALKTFSMTGNGEVQNPSRVHMSITLNMPTLGDRTVVAVIYDGGYYMSLDGGKTFTDAGSLSLQGVATSPDDLKTLLSGAAGVQDLGATVRDGQHVEHLQATLGPNYLNNMISKISGSGPAGAEVQQLSTLFAAAVSVRHGVLDLYVRNGDGHIESVDTDVTMAMDMGKFVSALTNRLGGQIPSGSGFGQVSGSLVMTMTGTNRFTDYGAKITVTKPTVDPNAPALPGLFGNSTGGA